MATPMRQILDRYRITSGKNFRLKDYDPADTAGNLLPQQIIVPRPDGTGRVAVGDLIGAPASGKAVRWDALWQASPLRDKITVVAQRFPAQQKVFDLMRQADCGVFPSRG